MKPSFDFEQVESPAWPSGYGEPTAVLRLSPTDLRDRYALSFQEDFDNLDYYEAAAIRLPSGRKVGLLRHRGNPASGTEIHIDSLDDAREAVTELLAVLRLSKKDISWVRGEEDVPGGSETGG